MAKCCIDCGEEMPLDDFYKHPRMKDGRLNSCKGCRNAYVRAWADKNRERRREISKQHATKVRTPAKSSAAFSRWYAKAKSSGGLASMYSRGAARRARERRATPSWAEPFFAEEAYRLAQLRTQVTGFVWHVDHKVPLQSPLVCGLHVIDNLQVIPATANLSKKNFRWPQMPDA